ncbi:hypothetical protein GGI15_004765 [Coemansia interrupta]|uniref:Transmembrane protein n=1 Tax=Coemansia interrupta TaxID=1126814 RepID=A0A9W8H1K9_9FUNG|nr:hypothetical protein GGI15_004765 [Coemansia interrupta]
MLAFISRGRRQSAITGAAFFAAVAAVGQFAYTKANQRRQQMIIGRMQMAGGLEAQPAEGKAGYNEEEEEVQQSTSLVSRLRRAVAVDPITLLPDWFPFRRIPSDEYREILELRREEVLFELDRIKQVLADMDQREELLLRQLQAVEK